MDRRQMLKFGAAALSASALPAVNLHADTPARVVQHGRIKQSVVPWCYKEQLPPEKLIDAAAALGFASVELIDPKHWPAIQQRGMTIAISGSHGFPRGFCNPAQWDECLKVLHERIDACAAAGVKRVITFTGMLPKEISRDQGYANTVEGLRKIAPYAEQKGVTLCMEHLNSRDASHPMKGHPGYCGDDVDRCIDAIRKVNSPNMKLLFDVYHVQIMNGDVIRRIREYRQEIGHVHTAGVPGRNELDDRQELQYGPIMRALLDVGYDGYVGHEFIPTGDALAGLRAAAKICDV
jgi:hydroxypyruvate isomerase